MSLLRLDPELQILAKYGKREPSNRDLKETKDTSRVGKGKQQSGIFVRRTERKQQEATVHFPCLDPRGVQLLSNY